MRVCPFDGERCDVGVRNQYSTFGPMVVQQVMSEDGFVSAVGVVSAQATCSKARAFIVDSHGTISSTSVSIGVDRIVEIPPSSEELSQLRSDVENVALSGLRTHFCDR